MSNERLQAAATILAGLLHDPNFGVATHAHPRKEVDLECAGIAWGFLAALDTTTPPSPASEGPVVRVEPTNEEWIKAEENLLVQLYQIQLYQIQRWDYCKRVSAEAYRLAAQRAKRARKP